MSKGVQKVWLMLFQLVFATHMLHILVVHAAPSTEACPHDSILLNDECVCNPDSCTKPPCLSNLAVAINGTEEPGSCCPIYSCEDCRNETLINGKCPCAPEAVINERGVCECVDQDTRLIDGECVCNPQQCELPLMCDRKSVLTTIEDGGCCKKTQCIPCPDDSESTNLETDELEDHCVCLPCKNDCGVNETVVIKKQGSGYPGNCCDLYECQPMEPTEKECTVDDIIYRDGDEWDTSDKQRCLCDNGLSLCTKLKDIESCFSNGNVYKHNQSWIKDDGCTNCTCIRGEVNCISHYCDFIISNMKKNDTHVLPCLRDNKIYEHLVVWQDGCQKCTCFNGEVTCDSKLCSEKPSEPLAPMKSECRPLFNCNKVCQNGFRLNKKGCKYCKCNPIKETDRILNKYNITMNDLINILENYKKNKHSTTSTLSSLLEKLELSSTASTTTSTTTSTTVPTTSSTPEAVPEVVILNRNKQEVTATEQPKVTPAEQDSQIYVIVGAIVLLATGACLSVTGIYIYRNKKKHSHDITPTRGSYQTVATISENNNIIKRKLSI